MSPFTSVRPWLSQWESQAAPTGAVRPLLLTHSCLPGSKPRISHTQMPNLLTPAPLAQVGSGDEDVIRVTSATSFTRGGRQYSVGDCVYVDSTALDQLPEAEQRPDNVPDYAAKGRYHKGGANAGLRAHGVARLVRLPGGRGARQVMGRRRDPARALAKSARMCACRRRMGGTPVHAGDLMCSRAARAVYQLHG